MAAKFSFPKNQRFECRDCPARCCRVPWNIRFSDEEIARYLDEPWIKERASEEGLRVLARGVLPMREEDRRLQCIFLDDDGLCAMQREFGHGYIPRSCQAFPFGFVRDERGTLVAQLSHLCPSIRENYGNPVEGQLKAKLEQRGETERISTAMSTLGRVLLTQKQYLAVARTWEKALAEDEIPITETLAILYDRALAFDRALPTGHERVKQAVFDQALREARDVPIDPLEPIKKPSFHARALHSYLLGNLAYPSRVRQRHRVGKAPALLGLRSFRNKWAFMRQRGKVDLLFLPRPISLARVRRIPAFLADPDASPSALVAQHLLRLIERRHIFEKPRYLLDILVDLCLATVLISRFARCSALAHERDAVTDADVREAISVAELVLTSHVTLEEEGQTMSNLRVLLLEDRERLRKLLASEA